MGDSHILESEHTLNLVYRKVIFYDYFYSLPLAIDEVNSSSFCDVIKQIMSSENCRNRHRL